MNNKGQLISNIIEDILPLVDQFVQATSFEQRALWKEFNESHVWISCNQGLGMSVGSHNTYIQFWFAKIKGNLVAFYDPTSSVVYWDEVHEFIKTFEKPCTNATNYYPINY